MLIPVKFVVMQLFCDWLCEPLAFGQPANFPVPAYDRWTDKTGLSTTFADRKYRYSTFTIFQLSAPENWVSDALSFFIASFNIVLKVYPSSSFHHFQSLSFQFSHVSKGAHPKTVLLRYLGSRFQIDVQCFRPDCFTT